jgi:hypothetical protein
MLVELDQLALPLQLVRKEVTQLLPQLQPMLLHHSHQTKHQEVVTTTQLKLKTISLLAHQEQPDIHLNVRQQALASEDRQEDRLLVSLIQELKLQLVVPHTQVRQLVHLTQLLDSHKDQPDLQQLLNVQQPLANRLDLELRHKDQLLEVSEEQDQAFKEVEAAAEAVDHHRQANKMKVKKEITALFPENLMSTIQSTLKFQKHLSTATNKNSQDITLMLKHVARSSIFAL